MSRRLITTDVHGGYLALKQCLDRCNFDYDNDTLYFGGDICDGFSQVKECIDLLLTIKNLVYLIGNHDVWTLEYYTNKMFINDNDYLSWQYHGGTATIKSFGDKKVIDKKYIDFLQKALPYHITADNILMIHAGYYPEYDIKLHDIDSLIWNRTFSKHVYGLYSSGYIVDIGGYKEIYIGHTPVQVYERNKDEPLIMGNVIMMDTGSCFKGKLSIMDIDTKELWQSEHVWKLYHDEKGRNDMSYTDYIKTNRKI